MRFDRISREYPRHLLFGVQSDIDNKICSGFTHDLQASLMEGVAFKNTINRFWVCNHFRAMHIFQRF